MSQRDTLRGKRILAGVCVAGPALVCLIPMAAAPAMPAMAQRFGSLGDGTLFAQMVMTVPAIMLIVAAPIAGLVAARFGRRITLLVSLLLYVIGGAGVLLVDAATPLIALRLLLGVAGGGLLTTSLALIGEHFEDNARETVLGYATSVSSVVAALALMFGGALVDGLGWRAPFSLYLLALPLIVAAFIVVKPAPSIAGEDAHGPHGNGGLVRMWPYYALLMLLTIGMFTPAIQLPFLLEARNVTSASLQGSIISATSIVAIFSAGAFGWGRKYIGIHGFLIIDTLSMCIGVLLIALAPATWVIFLGCLFIGIGAGLSEPAIASLIFDRTPAWVHALAMGLIVSALNLGQFVNPLAMAPLRHALGLSGAFLALSALLGASALLIFLRRRDDLVAHDASLTPLASA
ncbi:MFS transporter [Sphingobium sp. WCS2017Hpa-17]|uniref:MFS transporter n=1 Tax=Sphingobium sp. WCS2017Hpa-17 TaxID=3073638 RepID=UPI00288B2225|nr:MFS transporter [Sphingobium sp. WCS2017Hpa-17]